MTTDYLEYFVEVCNSGSIQSASKRLFVSAQGIGQGIQRLEKNLGVQLLQRNSSGVVPTAFGKQFYEQACVAIREVKMLEEMAERYKREKINRVVIGTLGKNKFLNGITSCTENFMRDHPERDLNVSVCSVNSSEELFNGVRNGDIDIGWLFHWREHSDMKYYSISDYSRLVLLVGEDNPIAGQETARWEEMKELRFVTAGVDDPFSELFKKLCLNNGFEPHISFYSTENTMIARLVDHNIAAIVLRENYCMAIAKLCKHAKIIPLEPDTNIANSLFVSANIARRKELDDYLRYMIDFFGNVMGLAETY